MSLLSHIRNYVCSVLLIFSMFVLLLCSFIDVFCFFSSHFWLSEFGNCCFSFLICKRLPYLRVSMWMELRGLSSCVEELTLSLCQPCQPPCTECMDITLIELFIEVMSTGHLSCHMCPQHITGAGSNSGTVLPDYSVRSSSLCLHFGHWTKHNLSNKRGLACYMNEVSQQLFPAWAHVWSVSWPDVVGDDETTVSLMCLV